MTGVKRRAIGYCARALKALFAKIGFAMPPLPDFLLLYKEPIFDLCGESLVYVFA